MLIKNIMLAKIIKCDDGTTTEIPCMVKTTVVNAAKESLPPVAITAASFMGIDFQSWVYILTAVYTLVQIFRLVPKIVGCGMCFYRNRTCKLDCKPTYSVKEDR